GGGGGGGEGGGGRGKERGQQNPEARKPSRAQSRQFANRIARHAILCGMTTPKNRSTGPPRLLPYSPPVVVCRIVPQRPTMVPVCASRKVTAAIGQNVPPNFTFQLSPP